MSTPSILPLAIVLLLAGLASGQTAPVAKDDAYSTTQDKNLSVDKPGVLGNDFDADKDPLTAILVDSSGTVGTLKLKSNGSFEYEPGTFLGTETFTYKANDGVLDSNPATITFEVKPGTTATGYTNEGQYLNALAAHGFTPVIESFENDTVWAPARYPSTALTVTSKGITWESPIGTSQVTTGPGPALHGKYGFFALPHGDYLAGPKCLTPGVCTDRWKGTSSQPLVAIGGWINAAGQGKVDLYLDDKTGKPIDLGGGGVTGWRFFGVIAPLGFHTFEFREMEGKSTDAVYIFGDKFTFARANPGPWVDLGNGLAGTHGIPRLTGSGTLAPGQPVTVTLDNALENSTAWLIIGQNRWDLPFLGGFLVPTLDIPGFPLALPTGPLGTVPLGATWPPSIPSGFTQYMQYWVIDPAGAQGYAASNGLSATTP